MVSCMLIYRLTASHTTLNCRQCTVAAVAETA
jgi:hypothetical protein